MSDLRQRVIAELLDLWREWRKKGHPDTEEEKAGIIFDRILGLIPDKSGLRQRVETLRDKWMVADDASFMEGTYRDAAAELDKVLSAPAPDESGPREACEELCRAAFVTDHSFIAPNAFEKAVRLARAALAASPLSPKAEKPAPGETWVSVKERLPEKEDDPILTYAPWDREPVRIDYYMGCLFARPDVTHWRPLPAPPKEETP